METIKISEDEVQSIRIPVKIIYKSNKIVFIKVVRITMIGGQNYKRGSLRGQNKQRNRTF